MTKRARSLAAKKAWATRRANERARSLAAKRGWKTRRAHAAARTKTKKITRLPKPPPEKKAPKPKPTRTPTPKAPERAPRGFFDWLITFQYHQKQSTRMVDFFVNRAPEDWSNETPSYFEFGDFELDLKDFHPAEGYARKYVGRTKSLYWMTKIEWDINIIRRGRSSHHRLTVVPR